VDTGTKPILVGVVSFGGRQHNVSLRAQVMNRRVGMGASALFALALVVAATPSASASPPRGIGVFVSVDGKLYLRGETGDDGKAEDIAVWRSLKTVPLRPAEGVKIEPDTPDRLGAVLRGKIEVTLRYYYEDGKAPKEGGKVTAKELRLIRGDADSAEWTIAPKDVEDLAKSVKK
jgi:hypothetical protein